MSARFALRHPIIWAQCNWLTIAATCAIKGHDNRTESSFRTLSYAWGNHPANQHLTFLSVCGRCGHFAGWHHHSRTDVLAERADCWICKQDGYTATVPCKTTWLVSATGQRCGAYVTCQREQDHPGYHVSGSWTYAESLEG